MRQAQEGDKAAYAIFLRETSLVLRAFLLKRMESIGAEDVLQETLISIHRSRHTYLPGRPLGPWLYAICENRMLDYFRQQRRRDRGVAAFKKEPSSSTTEPEPATSLLAAVGKLPGIQRKVIELLKIQDLSVKEVSNRMKMSESAVKVTAHRGYEAIRRMMGEKREN
jgi:RNA polymerase sigma-70 factor, ECF subfamily